MYAKILRALPLLALLFFFFQIASAGASGLYEKVSHDSFHAERFIDFDELNSMMNFRDEGDEKALAPDAMYGNNSLQLVVIDSISGEPITGYRVNAGILYAPGPFAQTVGWLETKVVENTEGATEYENLPTCLIELLVCADGYSLYGSLRNVTKSSHELTIVLSKEGHTISGQLMDSVTGLPVPDVAVVARYRSGRSHSKNHPQRVFQRYKTVTDGDGLFLFAGLPTDYYDITFANLSEEEAESNREESLGVNAPFYVHPELPKVVWKDDDSFDFGTIDLLRYPKLNLTIVDEGGEPVEGLPFEVVNRQMEGRVSDVSLHRTTDSNGQWSGWLEGWKVYGKNFIFAPESMADLYADPFTEVTGSTLLPEHPNSHEFETGFNQETNLTMVYTAPDSNLSFDINVKDGETGEDINSFIGKVCAGENISNYHAPATGGIEDLRTDQRNISATRCWEFSSNATGEARIDNLSLPPDFLRILQQEAQRDIGAVNDYSHESLIWQYPADFFFCGTYDPESVSYSGPLVLQVGLVAEGYVTEWFAYPIEEVRATGRVEISLRKGAVLKGRLITKKSGDASSFDLEPSWLRNLFELTDLSRHNQSINHEIVPEAATLLTTTVNPDGTFEFHGLEPGPSWLLSINAQGLLPLREEIPLPPGITDLGDVWLGTGGTLKGFVRSRDGSAVEDALVYLPYERRGFDDAVQTGILGEFSIPLEKAQYKKQPVRLIPPWGIEYHTDGRISEYPRIWYSKTMEIDREKETTIKAEIEKGDSLKITLLPSGNLAAVIEANNTDWEEVSPHKPIGKRIRYGKMELVSLDTDQGDFRYHQRFFVEGVQGISDEQKDFTLADVPNGRYAVRIDAAVYDVYESRDRHLDYGRDVPLSYAEIEVSDEQREFVMNVSSVQCTFSPPSDTDALSQENLNSIFFTFDRVEPFATGVGDQARLNLSEARNAAGPIPELQQVPFLGYYCGFSIEMGGELVTRTPKVLTAVPHGDYRLSVYVGSIVQLLAHNGSHPKHTEIITIDGSKDDYQIVIPYDPSWAAE